MKIQILLTLFILTVPLSLYAQNNSEAEPGFQIEEAANIDHENSQDEEEIIISADRLKRKKHDLSLPASVVDAEDIEENQYTSLADLLESTPGFSRVYDYHSPLILRGTTGKKMLILREGNPCFSSMPGGFMGQNVNIYDIDRIEVIRGPGSVIYGSGATSGIVNIIEKDIFEKEGLGMKAGTGYGTNSNMRMGIGQASWNNGFFALQVSGRYRKSDNMYYADGEEALNSFHEDKDFSLKTGFKFNEKNRLVFSTLLHYGGPWGKPYMFNQKEQIMVKNEDDNVYHFAGKYEGEDVGVFKHIRLSLFYDKETREYHKQKMNSTLSKVNYDEVVDYENKVYGGNIMGSVHLGNNNLSIGADGYSLKLWSPQKTIDYYTYSYPVDTEVKDGAQGAGTYDIGVFIQDRIELHKTFTIITGIRFDRAEVFEGDNPAGDEELTKDLSAVSGNAGLVYNVTKFSSLTFNAGRAFRMPSAFDMFTERVTCAGTLVPNPDLEPEYSWNFDVGYRGNIKGFDWDFALFSNIYSDLILKAENPDDPEEDMMANCDYARIMGGELSLAYKIREFPSKGMNLKPGVTVAYYRGDSFSNGEDPWRLWYSDEPLSGIPPVAINAYIRYSYMSDSFNYFFEIENDSSLKKTRLPAEPSESAWNNEDVSAYGLLNITTGISFFKLLQLSQVKLNIKLLNLLDHKYYAFGSHIPGKGRDLRIFLSAEY
jgi:hemoglobin/transferrin/lactoferrin receptor protein